MTRPVSPASPQTSSYEHEPVSVSTNWRDHKYTLIRDGSVFTLASAISIQCGLLTNPAGWALTAAAVAFVALSQFTARLFGSPHDGNEFTTPLPNSKPVSPFDSPLATSPSQGSSTRQVPPLRIPSSSGRTSPPYHFPTPLSLGFSLQQEAEHRQMQPQPISSAVPSSPAIRSSPSRTYSNPELPTRLQVTQRNDESKEREEEALALLLSTTKNFTTADSTHSVSSGSNNVSGPIEAASAFKEGMAAEQASLAAAEKPLAASPPAARRGHIPPSSSKEPSTRECLNQLAKNFWKSIPFRSSNSKDSFPKLWNVGAYYHSEDDDRHLAFMRKIL